MADERTLLINWFFKASPKAVWEAWTDPAKVRLWFGSDPQGLVLEAATDPRENGAYRVKFQNGDGTQFTCFGTYTAVVPFQQLNFTWAWEDRPEKQESIRIGLAAVDAGTAMRFEHSEIDPGTSHDYSEGWRRTFRKLDKAFLSK